MRSDPPITAGLVSISKPIPALSYFYHLPSTSICLGEGSELDLYTVYTVHAIDEEDQDKDKSDLGVCLIFAGISVQARSLTFMPYCSFATIGLSDMNVKSLRRHVKGSGTMRARKMTISATKRRNTCKQNRSKHVGTILNLVEWCGDQAHGYPAMRMPWPAVETNGLSKERAKAY